MLWIGGLAINAPLSTAGPLNVDFSGPVGVLGLLLGIAAITTLPSTWSRAAWGVAGVVVLGAVGLNFYRFPPIEDGAYFLLRYGAAAEGRWPAGPERTMLGFAVVALALDGAAWPSGPRVRTGRQRVGYWALAAVAIALCCIAYANFVPVFSDVDGPWPRALVLPALSIAACCAALHWRYRPEARLAFAFSLVLLLLSLATWALYALPLAGAMS